MGEWIEVRNNKAAELLNAWLDRLNLKCPSISKFCARWCVILNTSGHISGFHSSHVTVEQSVPSVQLISFTFIVWLAWLGILLAPLGALLVMMVYFISAVAVSFSDFHSVHWLNWCHKCHLREAPPKKKQICVYSGTAQIANWYHKMFGVSWGYLIIFLEYLWDIFWGPLVHWFIDPLRSMDSWSIVNCQMLIKLTLRWREPPEFFLWFVLFSDCICFTLRFL